MRFALELIPRGMRPWAGAGALKVKLDTVRFWLSQAAAHADLVNDALVQRVEAERVELDELWTFVRGRTALHPLASLGRGERVEAWSWRRPGSDARTVER